MKLYCNFCDKICKSYSKLNNVVKCKNCNVLYELSESYSDHILAYYILSINDTIDFDKDSFLYGIHNQFMVNGKIPKYCLIKYSYLSDFLLYEISIFKEEELSTLIFKQLAKNSQILSQITPDNFDKKLKTILTFM